MKDYLLAYSYRKWIKVEVKRNTRTQETIEALRKWFGVPLKLVSDNGPQFISAEFEHFVQMNRTNRRAERFVQTIKKELSAYYIQRGDLHRKLDSFLLAYRSTPLSVTGKTPCELFLGR